MTITKRFSKCGTWVLVCASALAVGTCAAQGAEVLPPAAAAAQNPASTAQAPIPVVEFFTYGCPHCAAIQPMVDQWAPYLPKTETYLAVPVAWNASMKDMQRLYFTLARLHRLDLHASVFEAIHTRGETLFHEAQFLDWAQQHGIDREAFRKVYESEMVTRQVATADALAARYRVSETPTFVVGRYMITPSQTGSNGNTILASQKVLDILSRKTPEAALPAGVAPVDEDAAVVVPTWSPQDPQDPQQ